MFLFKIKNSSLSVCTALFCTNSSQPACLAMSGSAAAEGTDCGVGKVKSVLEFLFSYNKN